MFKFCAWTTFAGRLFHTLMHLAVKKFFRIFNLEPGFTSFRWCPRVLWDSLLSIMNTLVVSTSCFPFRKVVSTSYSPFRYLYTWITQGRRKYLKLEGAQHFEGTFFLKKKGACSKHEKGNSLFIEKSWGGTCPQCPLGSYVSASNSNLRKLQNFRCNQYSKLSPCAR